MKYHKIRLAFIRHQYTILIFVVSFFLLTILILQIMLIRSALEQSKKNEDVLRGLSCILLIQPLDRTKDNVTECVKSNTKNKSSSFDFNDDPASSAKRNVYTTEPIKQKNGLDSTTQDVKTPIEPRPPVATKPLVEIEVRVNPKTNLEECRVTGDSLWKSITDNECVKAKLDISM